MKKIIKTSLLILSTIITIGLILLWISNERELSIREEANCNSQLNKSQKTYLQESFRLKRKFGEKVWPGLDTINIPIIVFNNCYEFLLGLDSTDKDWTKIESDKFYYNFYWRRDITEPKAFAVLVNGKWACKMGELNQMNFEFLNGIRQEFPPVIAQLFPYFFAKIEPDQYIVSLLHETFHAYQAINNTSRFKNVESLYSLEKKYPYDNADFIKLWNKEGRLLYEAFSTNDKDSTKKHIQDFLQTRKRRREMFHFTEDLINFERELEWLEGLAKYAEIRFYELAAEESRESEEIQYRKGLPHWEMEFDRLREKLGKQKSDFRFYLSGMAQARALDLLYPEWKKNALQEDIFLEDLLDIYSSN